MRKIFCINIIIVLTLFKCSDSYSDVRNIPSFPDSQAAPISVSPSTYPPGHPPPYNPADMWMHTPKVDSLTQQRYGVVVKGYQQHWMSDSVSFRDLRAFFNVELGKRGFSRDTALDERVIPHPMYLTGTDETSSRVAAWVLDAPGEGGTVDRTVVTVAYATPWRVNNEHHTFYVSFLGRGLIETTEQPSSTGSPH